MQTKTIISLFAGAFLLIGCASSGHYPITGQDVGIDDQVRFMSAPAMIQY